MASQLSDILSSASLLVTIVALLYSLWYAEMQAALAVERQIHLEDRGPAIMFTRSTLKTKAVPLVVASILQVVVFGPDAVNAAFSIVTSSAGQASLLSLHYDSVEAAFVSVYLVAVLLAGLALTMAIRLRQKVAALQVP